MFRCHKVRIPLVCHTLGLVFTIIQTQVSALRAAADDEVVTETRVWDEHGQETHSMRRKEGMADYRFFPEPDLPPLVISEEAIEAARVRIIMSLWRLFQG